MREVRLVGRKEVLVEAIGNSWRDCDTGAVGSAEVEARDERSDSELSESWPVELRRTSCEGSVRGAAISLSALSSCDAGQESVSKQGQSQVA